MTVIKKILATSLEYVPIDVTPPIGLDPTGDSVRVAWIGPGDVIPARDPGDPLWRDADWEPPVSGARVFRARCLYGDSPGTGALDRGRYNTLIWITDSPEAPVREAGILVVE